MSPVIFSVATELAISFRGNCPIPKPAAILIDRPSDNHQMLLQRKRGATFMRAKTGSLGAIWLWSEETSAVEADFRRA